MEKEINIVAPEGYEIDKENSTFECIKFKPIQRFKVGDWVVYCNEDVDLITGIEENGYCINNGDGYIPFICESDIRLWTIQDAKDGDVLKEDSCTFIVKRMKTDGTAITHCCLFDDGEFDSGFTLCFDVDSTYPATQEQRNLLFQKMKEAGYEWDDEKKEPRVIDWGKHIKYEPNSPSITEEPWSYEDEENLNQLHKLIVKKAYEEYEIDTEDETLWGKHAILDNWLKSIKERIKGGY